MPWLPAESVVDNLKVNIIKACFFKWHFIPAKVKVLNFILTDYVQIIFILSNTEFESAHKLKELRLNVVKSEKL